MKFRVVAPSLFFSIFLCTFVFSVGHASSTEDQLLNEIVSESLGSELDIKKIRGKQPVGNSNSPLKPECSLLFLENDLLNKAKNTNEFSNLVSNYVKKCEKQLQAKSNNGLLGLLEFSSYNYPFFNNRRVSYTKISLPSGLVVPAVLAIKDEYKKRPWIVIKCGVFCGADETASTKGYLMNFFDQAPFNVVILANRTSADYIKANRFVSMGGWDEGREVWEVGYWLKNLSNYKGIISSLHLVGVSLGGNAATVGVQYNDRYPDIFGNKVFNSSTAICPVFSLKPTLDRLYGRPIVGRVFAKFTKNHFSSMKNFVDDVPDLVVENKIPESRKDYPYYLGSIMAESLNRRGLASTPESFFKLNNFWNIKNSIKTPMLVFASKDDFIVDYKLNSEVFKNDPTYKKDSSKGIVSMNEGTHCAFSSSYGVGFPSVVLRSYILSHDPYYKKQYTSENKLNWPVSYPDVSRFDVHVEQRFKFESRSDEVKVEFLIFNRLKGLKCYTGSPWSADRECMKTKTVLLPIKYFEQLGAFVPKNAAEADHLSRNFNSKVSLMENGKLITGTNNDRFELVYRD